MHIARWHRVLVAVLAVALAAPASAQEEIDPEGGDVYVPPVEPPPEEPPPPQQPTPWYQGGPTGTAPPPPTEPTPPPAPEDERDDHERVVQRLGVGYMGLTAVPTEALVAINGGPTPSTISAPALGVRYWFDPLIGLDVGLGLGVIVGSTSSDDISVPINNAFALSLHGGVPIAIAHDDHYKFLIIPEVNLAFATGTRFSSNDPDFDRGTNGFLFQLGARIGTEIHFGFMDIPQLSLQASVGLYLQYASAGIGADAAGTQPSFSQNTFTINTSVQGEPWDVFLGALTALYYF